MKLYVDDIRNAPDESWTVARTVLSAIRAISMFEFETISLDHDISHQVSVGGLSRPYPCEETYESVAWYIAEKYLGQAKVNRPNIILHTSNPIGAEKMAKILSDFECLYSQSSIANRLEMEI